MQLLQAIVKGNPRQVNTRYGERTVMDCSTSDGQTVTVWGAASSMDILGRRAGERVTLGLDSKGKYHIVETLSSGLDTPYQSYSAPVATPTTAPKPSQPENELNRLIERHAVIMAKCVREIKGQLGDVSDDIIQKYATSLYIQISRQLEAF